MGKGEIAHYQQFFLFPECFQKTCTVDDNIKFDKSRRMFSKQIENTVGKGEIACYEHFLLFPLCFQKTSTADMKKPGLIWEKVKRVTSS